MFKFIQAKDKKTYNYLYLKFGYAISSDESDIEGWVVEDEDIKRMPSWSVFKIYEIPEKYQNNIDDFKSDYWDGNFTFI